MSGQAQADLSTEMPGLWHPTLTVLEGSYHSVRPLPHVRLLLAASAPVTI